MVVIYDAFVTCLECEVAVETIRMELKANNFYSYDDEIKGSS